MSAKIAVFQKSGARLYAEVTRGFVNNGSYTISLWEANSNKKAIPDITGNFINDQDDCHPLPTPNHDNDGRVVECFALIEIVPPEKSYSVTLSLFQGDTIIQSETKSGKSNKASEIIVFYIILQEAP
jgi:hypothetical protein